MTEKDQQRFWSKVNLGTEENCWDWTASCVTAGYGKFSYKSKAFDAHRFSYFLHFGEIPRGMFVCHRCDNPKCVNPSHLFLGTNLDNVKDMIAKRLHRFGDKTSRSKVANKEIKKIKTLYKKGISQKQLAKKFGICQSSISRILSGKNHKYASEY